MSHPAARGPRYRQLPLWRDAQRFLLEVELAVRAFPRYHKYTLGSDLPEIKAVPEPKKSVRKPSPVKKAE